MLKDGVNRGTTLLGACAPTLPPPRMLQHGRGRVPITGDSAGQPFCQKQSPGTRRRRGPRGRPLWEGVRRRPAWPGFHLPWLAVRPAERVLFPIDVFFVLPASVARSPAAVNPTKDVVSKMLPARFLFVPHQHNAAESQRPAYLPATFAPEVRTMPLMQRQSHAMIQGEKTNRPAS